MIRSGFNLCIISAAALFLSSCSLFQNNAEQNHRAICKELNRQIIFNGASANPAVATQQRAEMETLTKNYRDEGCS